MPDRFRQTESELAQALALRAGAELVTAIAENPKTRHAAERFASALLLATSAAELEQQAKVVSIGRKGGERG